MLRWLAGLMLATRLYATDWPSFRGPHAAGVADGQNLPAEWNAATGQGVLFKVTIPRVGAFFPHHFG